MTQTNEWTKLATIADSPVLNYASRDIPDYIDGSTSKAEVEYNQATNTYSGAYHAGGKHSDAYDMNVEEATSLDDAIRIADEWLAENGRG